MRQGWLGLNGVCRGGSVVGLLEPVPGMHQSVSLWLVGDKFEVVVGPVRNARGSVLVFEDNLPVEGQVRRPEVGLVVDFEFDTPVRVGLMNE
jgi:hypothetical protein